MPADLKAFLTMATKHGAWMALAVAVLWFVRVDVFIPMVQHVERQDESLQKIDKTLDRLLYATVKGEWRATEPPAEPQVPPKPQ